MTETVTHEQATSAFNSMCNDIGNSDGACDGDSINIVESYIDQSHSQIEAMTMDRDSLDQLCVQRLDEITSIYVEISSLRQQIETLKAERDEAVSWQNHNSRMCNEAWEENRDLRTALNESLEALEPFVITQNIRDSWCDLESGLIVNDLRTASTAYEKLKALSSSQTKTNIPRKDSSTPESGDKPVWLLENAETAWAEWLYLKPPFYKHRAGNPREWMQMTRDASEAFIFRTKEDAEIMQGLLGLSDQKWLVPTEHVFMSPKAPPEPQPNTGDALACPPEYKGPYFVYDFMPQKIMFKSAMGDSQALDVLNVRGWGMLAGHGQHGKRMPPEVAALTQDTFGKWVAKTLNDALTSAGTVKIPTSQDEARAMNLISERWLKDNPEVKP